MKTVVAYISAHGFGHWAQMAPVLGALHGRDAGIRFVLRTALPKPVLEDRADFPFTHVEGQVDIGVIQRDAVHEDIPATIAAVEGFHGNWQDRVGEEAGWLRERRADLVLSDIAPLAFAAAARAGIATIAVGSIDWHGIYAPLLPSHHPCLAQIAAAHRQCDLLLRLPLGMPMPSFPRQRPLALIAGKGSAPRLQTRRELGLADGERLTLVMFGGSGMPAFRVAALAGIRGWRFIMPAAPSGQMPANVQAMPADAKIVDLIAAADVIVCKPGYGTLSEAWRAGTPIVYVPRPGFPEYAHLKDWLAANAPAVELDAQAFVSGDWTPALQAALASHRRYPPCGAGGEGEAAAIIHAALSGV